MLSPLNVLKRNDNFHSEDSPMRRFQQVPTALLLAGMVLAAGCLDPVRADEMRVRTPDADARRLAEEAMRKAGGNDRESLDAWSRSVIDRALERARGTARQTIPGSAGQSTAPLPAERHAGRFADDAGKRGATAEVLIFASLLVPAQSWRQWARDAARSGAPLVLRGVGAGGLRETAKRIGARLGGHDAGVAIDPRLYRLFGIERVPAVVVAPGGVPPCRSRGCANDPAPPHDRIAGNIGLIAALEAIADEGAVGRDVARRHLERLRMEDRP